jgi:hypothetical protein
MQPIRETSISSIRMSLVSHCGLHQACGTPSRIFSLPTHSLCLRDSNPPVMTGTESSRYSVLPHEQGSTPVSPAATVSGGIADVELLLIIPCDDLQFRQYVHSLLGSFGGFSFRSSGAANGPSSCKIKAFHRMENCMRQGNKFRATPTYKGTSKSVVKDPEPFFWFQPPFCQVDYTNQYHGNSTTASKPQSALLG